VGSQSTIDLAYIAGFLDGDGSIMFQIKQRRDGKRKWRFMCTICLYQDTRHKDGLQWIRNFFGIGYLSDRKDGMTELRINGFKQVRDILNALLPFIRFKKKQAEIVFHAADLLSRKRFTDLETSDLIRLVDSIIALQNSNYATHTKRTKDQLLAIIDLTP
jgi:hypothetical protein